MLYCISNRIINNIIFYHVCVCVCVCVNHGWLWVRAFVFDYKWHCLQQNMTRLGYGGRWGNGLSFQTHYEILTEQASLQSHNLLFSERHKRELKKKLFEDILVIFNCTRRHGYDYRKQNWQAVFKSRWHLFAFTLYLWKSINPTFHHDPSYV